MTEDIMGLVKRLRANDLSDNASGIPCILCCEAADAIERLSEKPDYPHEEIAALRAERDELAERCALLDRALTAVREALEKIANVPDDIDAPYYPTQYARAALEGK